MVAVKITGFIGRGESETTDTTPSVDGIGGAYLDEERLLSTEPYEIILNPVVGQEHRLLERGVDTDGEFLRAELRYQADATSFTEHVHPTSDETFKVLSGELVVAVDGDEQLLGPGEQVTLPAGVSHTHQNVTGIETAVLWEVRPPVAAVDLLRALATLAREGKTDAEGTPNPLALAVFLDAHPDVVYLASPPIPVQKLLFKLLAPLGRRRGYTADYSPV